MARYTKEQQRVFRDSQESLYAAEQMLLENLATLQAAGIKGATKALQRIVDSLKKLVD